MHFEIVNVRTISNIDITIAIEIVHQFHRLSLTPYLGVFIMVASLANSQRVMRAIRVVTLPSLPNPSYDVIAIIAHVLFLLKKVKNLN